MAHTKRSTRLQEKRETTTHARDDKPNSDKNTDLEHTAIWNTFLQEKDETTRHSREDKPKIQKTREASVYKRTLRLQDTREMTSLMRTRTQTRNTLLIKIGAGRRPAPQDKRSARLQEKNETARHA